MNQNDRDLLINSRRAARLWKTSGVSFSLADDTGRPKHERLREELLKSIEAFALRPYDALPSEAGLCELYGVSRTVVRQTLEGLENDGLIFRINGKGSFIAETNDADLSRFTLRGLYTQVARAERVEFTSTVLRSEFRRVPGEIARKLHVAPGDKAFYLERLRSVDGLPWVRIESYVPLPFGEQVARHDPASKPLHAIFSDCGSQVARANREVEVVPAEAEIARFMRIENFPVLLVVTSVHHDAKGQVLEYSRASYRADSSRLEFSVVEHPGDP